MSTAEERQAKAQEAIAKYMNQLVPVFKEINRNLAEFVKLTEFVKVTAPKKVAMVVKQDLEAAKQAATHPEGPIGYIPPEGYAAGVDPRQSWIHDPELFQKEGE